MIMTLAIFSEPCDKQRLQNVCLPFFDSNFEYFIAINRHNNRTYVYSFAFFRDFYQISFICALKIH